jgi:hemerythrin-like domain-containing protein
MKRNINLQPLSRQHHNALMAVLLLKKGVAKTADTEVMKDFILSIWNEELKEHFVIEEKIFFSHHRNKALTSLIEQMNKEHQAIKEMIGGFLSSSATLQLIAQFYQILEQHIRFEERVLFPAVEKVVDDDALNEMGKQFSLLPQNSCVNFPVKFWE